MSSEVLDIRGMKKDLLVNLVDQLEAENTALKARIAELLTPNPVTKIEVTPEELICVEQIDILRSKSANRELSLDECKRLDLLVKNLRLIRNESIDTINTTDYSKVINEEDLVRIATGRLSEPS